MRDWLIVRASSLRDDAKQWCEGRNPWGRAALLAYLAYAGVRHLLDAEYRSWFAGITLAFHEMGHIVFIPLGRTLTILGGSIFQLLIPAAAGAYLLLRQRDWFGLAVAGSWLSFSTWELATYVGDAATERLALVGFSGNPEHDWSTLLTQWRLLNYDGLIASGVRVIAFGIWAASVALGCWLCYLMVLANRRHSSPPSQ